VAEWPVTLTTAHTVGQNTKHKASE